MKRLATLVIQLKEDAVFDFENSAVPGAFKIFKDTINKKLGVVALSPMARQ